MRILLFAFTLLCCLTLTNCGSQSEMTGKALISRSSHIIYGGNTETKGANLKQRSYQLSFKPLTPYKINILYPWAINLTLPAGITAVKSTLSKNDAAKFNDQAAIFRFDLQASNPGQFVIEVLCQTSFCTDKECIIPKETIKIEVTF